MRVVKKGKNIRLFVAVILAIFIICLTSQLVKANCKPACNSGTGYKPVWIDCSLYDGKESECDSNSKACKYSNGKCSCKKTDADHQQIFCEKESEAQKELVFNYIKNCGLQDCWVWEDGPANVIKLITQQYKDFY